MSPPERHKPDHNPPGNDRYSIQVDAVATYIAEESDADDDRYVFAYTITVSNVGDIPATLLSRHWIITNANGDSQEVRGEGVVGEQPHLQPGEGFQYTSWTMIDTPLGSMQGSYQMLADDGFEFEAPIEPFQLAVPHTLH